MAVGVVWVVGVVMLMWCRCGNGDNNTPTSQQDSLSLHKVQNLSSSTGLRTASGGKVVVCYYTLPHNGSSTPPLCPRDLDPSLCTHLVIAGAQVVNTSIVPLQPQDVKVYADVVGLKQQVPSLRVLLGLHYGLYALAQDRLAVSVFAYTAGQFLVQHGFDGLDVDWDGPVKTPPRARGRARTGLAYLLLQLNNALKLASHPPLLLTAKVRSSRDSIDHFYDAGQLAKTVDYVSVGCYNFHTFTLSLPFTGHNAPLRSGPQELGYWATLNLQWATQHWLEAGLPKEKLLVGLPTFGHTWKLLASKWNSVGAPAVRSGMLNGTVAYSQTCIFLQEGATRHYDTQQRAPYTTRGTDWVSYEDPSSITEKVEWVVKEGVAGVMVQDLNSDDWPGWCGGGRYPLLHAAREALRNSPSPRPLWVAAGDEGPGGDQ